MNNMNHILEADLANFDFFYVGIHFNVIMIITILLSL